MDGSNDVHPESGYHAPDPSLEEMLRRARDARLGDARDNDVPTPPAYGPAREQRVSRVRDWLLVVAGVLAGVLLSVCVIDVAATVSSWTAAVSPAAPTAAATATPAAPTSTPTPFPTATPVPTATAAIAVPPTADEIIRLVQDFYDNQGPYAGSYIMLDVTGLQIQSRDETQLTVCISYEAATVDAPDTAAASNTRPFTLAANSEGSWQVVAMGESGSCSIS